MKSEINDHVFTPVYLTSFCDERTKCTAWWISQQFYLLESFFTLEVLNRGPLTPVSQSNDLWAWNSKQVFAYGLRLTNTSSISSATQNRFRIIDSPHELSSSKKIIPLSLKVRYFNNIRLSINLEAAILPSPNGQVFFYWPNIYRCPHEPNLMGFLGTCGFSVLQTCYIFWGIWLTTAFLCNWIYIINFI